MSITAEVRIFISAVFSGICLFSGYYLLSMLRGIIHHARWAVDLEDILFWILAGIYLFVQIYHTNNGSIRLYYVLGIVLGALFTWKIIHFSKKMWKKFVHSLKEKNVD